jgi:hypothetical protein
LDDHDVAKRTGHGHNLAQLFSDSPHRNYPTPCEKQFWASMRVGECHTFKDESSYKELRECDSGNNARRFRVAKKWRSLLFI